MQSAACEPPVLDEIAPAGESVAVGPRPRLTWEAFEVRSRVLVGWAKHETGVHLVLAPEGDFWSTLDIDVSPDGAAHLPKGWLMVKGVPYSQKQDPFVSATGTVHRCLGIGRAKDSPWTDEQYAVWGPRSREEMRRFYALAKDLAVHAASRCDPDARAAALRFNPHLRTWLYARLVSDDTRRLIQLATTCPGVLIFARCLDEREKTRQASAKLLEDLVAGRRLDAAIDDAVEEWANRFPGMESPRMREAARWPFLMDPMRPDRLKILRTQRLLVRRAGPRVATSLLWTEAPFSVVPEDIPRAVRANARWFALMKCHPWFRTAPAPGTERNFAAISNLFSAQFERIPKGRTPYERQCMVGDLLDFLLTTGRTPPRDADWRALMRASRAWHRRFARPGPKPAEVPPDGPLPVRHGAWSAPGVTITPVDTVHRLFAEGREMRHCVATRLSDAAHGHCFIFSVVVDRKRLTLELRDDGRRLSMGDFRGKGNRYPTAAEHAAVNPWLVSLRRGRDPAES